MVRSIDMPCTGDHGNPPRIVIQHTTLFCRFHPVHVQCFVSDPAPRCMSLPCTRLDVSPFLHTTFALLETIREHTHIGTVSTGTVIFNSGPHSSSDSASSPPSMLATTSCKEWLQWIQGQNHSREANT